MKRRILIGIMMFGLVSSAFAQKNEGKATVEKAAVVEVNNHITNYFEFCMPAVESLHQLRFTIMESRGLINHWVNVQSKKDDPEKQKLNALMKKKLPQNIRMVNGLAENWHNKKEKELWVSAQKNMEELLAMYKQIQSALATFENYDDPATVFIVRPMVAPGGDIDRKGKETLAQLDNLLLDISNRGKQIEEVIKQKMNKMVK
jgi:hypothetical protein